MSRVAKIGHEVNTRQIFDEKQMSEALVALLQTLTNEVESRMLVLKIK